MSAEIAKESGHVLTMKVSGTLSLAELAGMRPFPIRYFEPAQISNARLWLDAQEKSD